MDRRDTVIALIAFAVASVPIFATSQAQSASARPQESDKVYTPPRSVADIIGRIEVLQGDRSEIERRKQLMAAAPLASASGKEQVIFYIARARAAEALGETARAISDLRKALELSNHFDSYWPVLADRRWILATLAGAEQNTGNLVEGIRLYRQLLDEATSAGWRVYALFNISRQQGESGDLAGMEQSVRQAEAVYAGAWMESRSWSIWEHDITRFHQLTRAWHHFYFGRYQEAELAVLRALRASEEFTLVARANRARGNPLGAPGFEVGLHEQVMANLAIFQMLLNKLNEAEYYARKALTSKLSRNRYASADLAGPLESLGLVMLFASRFKDAEALFRETLRVFDDSGVVRTAARALVAQRSLAVALAGQERWREALGVYRETLSHAQTGAAKGLGEADSVIAYSQLRSGEAAAAAVITRERLDWYEKYGLGDSPRAIMLRGVHALALSESGHVAEAEREFEAVIPRLIGRGAPSFFATDATALVELHKRWIVEGFLEHLRKKADDTTDVDSRGRTIEEALVASDAVRGRSVQLAINQASLRAAASTPGLAELARKEQDLRNEIGSLYAVLNSRLSATDGRSGAIEEQMRARIALATEELVQIVERTRREFTGYADLVAPRLPELAQLRGALREGEALLALHLAGERAFAWLVGREGPVVFHSTDGRAAIEAEIKLLRRAVDPNAIGNHDHIPAFDAAVAHSLYSRLVKPFEPALAKVRKLVVVANGALQQLPLGVLVTEAHRVVPDTVVNFREYRPVPWLAKRFAVTHAPSLSAFLSLRARPSGSEGRLAFAGFGDPIFSKEQAVDAAAPNASVGLRSAKLALRNTPQTRSLDSAELARLPRLPDTAEEITSIAKTLGAVPERDTFLGRRANERELGRANLISRKVVAFATHGLVPGDLDGLTQPALALTAPEVAGVEGDGLLTMEEVLQLKLDADWVVLSACNTASGDGAGAEAITGLGRAFFYAGARSLLVSGWPVETVSAKLLTPRIFEVQSAEPSLGRAEALRRSMLELLEHGEALGADGKPEYSYAHPLFWAPFSVIGDGS